MKPFSLLIIVALAAAFGQAGCRSPVRPQGDFHLGDTPEIVEAAVGRPNSKQERTGTGGPEMVWTYERYHDQRLETTGWSEVLVPGVYDQSEREIRKPVTREIRRKKMDRDMLVVFIGGRVSYVEFQTRLSGGNAQRN